MARVTGGIQKYSVVEANNTALGQVGSAFLDSDGTTFTPTDGVVVAITMITDCGFDTLTAEGGVGTFFNTDGAGDGGDTYAATLIAGAVNYSAQTGAGAGTIHLPTSTKGVHLVLDYTDVVDGSTGAQTIAVNGGALLSTGTTLISGSLYAKQAIGSATGVAGNTIETAGTAGLPTSVNLIYTPTTGNNWLGAGSMIHFFCPADGQWLVNIKHVQQGTGATGALSVS